MIQLGWFYFILNVLLILGIVFVYFRYFHHKRPAP